jgi:hypothetical protein
MTISLRWLFSLTLAGGTLLGGLVVADAQPTVRDNRDRRPAPKPDVRDHRRPREAPPPPRAEKVTPPRPGFVWVAGSWDWKNDKWEWIPGRWERERAGKQWRQPRWEKKGDYWELVAGAWIDGGAPAPVPTPAPGYDRPRVAPPSPRQEKVAARAGFVWVPGNWDWKNGKWEWVAGRWERERAGKQWREPRWEKKGDYWELVAGAWIDGGPAPAPGYDRPREAPPSPRQEKVAARAGFVWVPGNWDWKNGKWEWIAGRWERVRAGKQWREPRWERKGDYWELVAGAWIDAGPAGLDYPTEAPPSPREERIAARAGFVWIPGRWEWKNRKWEWTAGRWERERAGKKFREGRWERQGDRWVYLDGDWIDAAGAPAIRDHRRPKFTLERAVVGSYWPVKGKAGTRVVIRGKNFGPDTTVIWGGQPLRGARVKPEEIAFLIPKDATGGTIAVRTANGRTLPVGAFEVVADFDPIAEQKKLEEERRRAAEAAVAERQRKLARDRAAREAEINRRIEERIASREQRRADRIAQLQTQWDRAFLRDEQTQFELTLHSQRVADLVRMAEVAELSNNQKLAVRVEVARAREDARHAQRMATLKAAFQGGRP